MRLARAISRVTSRATRALPMIAAVLLVALASCSSAHNPGQASISVTAAPRPTPQGSERSQSPSPVPTSDTTSDTTPSPLNGTAPADPAAAETQIRAVFAAAFSKPPGSARYYGLGFVENGDQLRGAVDRVLARFPHAGNDITATIGAITFTSPDSAAVEFTPHYTGGAPYGTQTGEAVFAGGRWVVTQETYCGLLRYGGVSCP